MNLDHKQWVFFPENVHVSYPNCWFTVWSLFPLSSPEFSLGKRSYGCPPVYGFEYARDFFEDTAAGSVYRYHPERVDTVTCHSSCGTSCREVRVRMWVTRIHKYECFNSQTRSKEIPVKCVCAWSFTLRMTWRMPLDRTDWIQFKLVRFLIMY